MAYYNSDSPANAHSAPQGRSQPGQAGDIVLYIREGRFFVHRIASKSSADGQVFLIARGDCMSQQDPAIRETELLGTVTEVRRNGALLAPTLKLSPFRLIFAWMLCHWNLFQRVALRLHARRRSSADSDFAFLVGRAVL